MFFVETLDKRRVSRHHTGMSTAPKPADVHDSASRYVISIACDLTPELKSLNEASAAAWRAKDDKAVAELRERRAAAVSLKVERVEFDSTDAKGRAIGAKIITAEAGGVYLAHTGATRNGEHFGAAQPVRRFSSEAERAVWRTSYLAGARTRAEGRQGK